MKPLMDKIIRQRSLLLMLLPGILFMIIFNYIPMYGVTIAFRDYKITRPVNSAEWIGFANFIEFFGDKNFWATMQNTLGISILKLLICFPLPILFAILLNELTMPIFKKSVQTISYLPHFLSWVVLGGILTTWLGDGGMINEVLIKMGIIKESITFLAEPKYFWGITVVSDLWKELGWSAIIYLAAIAGISQDMYEAATVDGANKIQKIWNITLPSIAGTICILLVLAVAGMLNSNFDQIFVLKNTLNQPRSEVIDTYVFQMGIRSSRHAYATAIGLFKSVIATILLLIANEATKRLQGSSLF